MNFLASEVNTFPCRAAHGGSQIYPRYNGGSPLTLSACPFPLFPPRDFSIEKEKKGEETRRAITVWQGFPLDGGEGAHTKRVKRDEGTKARARRMRADATIW